LLLRRHSGLGKARLLGGRIAGAAVGMAFKFKQFAVVFTLNNRLLAETEMKATMARIKRCALLAA
jgi:hypothetical protein